MAKSYRRKHEHEHQTQRRDGRDSLTRRYREFKLKGPDPGDFCPDCLEPTDFRSGFLCCDGCGWADIGTEAIGFVQKTVA